MRSALDGTRLSVARNRRRSDHFEDLGHVAFYAGSARCGKKDRAAAAAAAAADRGSVTREASSLEQSLQAIMGGGLDAGLVMVAEAEPLASAAESPLTLQPALMQEVMAKLATLQGEVQNLKERQKRLEAQCQSSSSSSSSSESSSDSDNDIKSMRKAAKMQKKEMAVARKALRQPVALAVADCKANPAGTLQVAMPAVSGMESMLLETSKGLAVASMVGGEVEVCMGSKCKRNGAHKILSALQAHAPAGSPVAVMPCKCLGKCKSAANVRFTREDSNPQTRSFVDAADAEALLEQHFGMHKSFTGLPSLSKTLVAPKILQPVGI